MLLLVWISGMLSHAMYVCAAASVLRCFLPWHCQVIRHWEAQHRVLACNTSRVCYTSPDGHALLARFSFLTPSPLPSRRILYYAQRTKKKFEGACEQGGVDWRRNLWMRERYASRGNKISNPNDDHMCVPQISMIIPIWRYLYICFELRVCVSLRNICGCRCWGGFKCQ